MEKEMKEREKKERRRKSENEMVKKKVEWVM